MRTRPTWILAAAGLAALAACSSASGHDTATTPPRPTPPTSASTPSTVAPVATDRTVWLCRPGQQPDPCGGDLTATSVAADGTRRVEPAPAPRPTDLDCFYVYPTVSRESGANADLRVQPQEMQVAVAQAARFSSACRVWAPMYRQRTTSDLSNLPDDAPASAANLRALASLRAAWRDYLAHDNQGRRVVFIGHSQGAAMLIRLLREDIDPHPALRAKTALALLIGGNVTVAPGRTVGGSFAHLPLCTHKGQRSCVIAYSSFPRQPPGGAFFGRAGFGVSFLSGESAATSARDVACVNPAALAGGSALLHPYYPTGELPAPGVTTPWVATPGRYRAQCRHGGGASWLQVTPTGGAADQRETVTEALGPLWGYHIVDVNLALGDLVRDVDAVGSPTH